jgi:hypothetical protein
VFPHHLARDRRVLPQRRPNSETSAVRDLDGQPVVLLPQRGALQVGRDGERLIEEAVDERRGEMVSSSASRNTCSTVAASKVIVCSHTDEPLRRRAEHT